MCACLGVHVQVVTGDSWASGITRSLYPPDETDHAVAFFFVSYVLIGGTVLINIVLTVLLDEFLKAVALEKEKADEVLEAEHEACRIAGVLDPLIESMSHFTDNNDLTQNIATTFTVIDEVRLLRANDLPCPFSRGVSYVPAVCRGVQPSKRCFQPVRAAFKRWCWRDVACAARAERREASRMREEVTFLASGARAGRIRGLEFRGIQRQDQRPADRDADQPAQG